LTIIKQGFYQRPDVIQVARELLGKHVCTRIGGVLTTGRIVETEAYCHAGDDALSLHLLRKRHQARGLYLPGGHAYIYSVYNRAALFNLTTNEAAHPDAVLLRAIEPVLGIAEMLRRRGLPKVQRQLTAGPGRLSQALGITPALSGAPLSGEVLWLEDHGETVVAANILVTARVGLAYAGPVATGLPWRFRLLGSK
jgi:DNA-3-methyladenine glycosylase